MAEWHVGNTINTISTINTIQHHQHYRGRSRDIGAFAKLEPKNYARSLCNKGRSPDALVPVNEGLPATAAVLLHWANHRQFYDDAAKRISEHCRYAVQHQYYLYIPINITVYDLHNRYLDPARLRTAHPPSWRVRKYAAVHSRLRPITHAAEWDRLFRWQSESSGPRPNVTKWARWPGPNATSWAQWVAEHPRDGKDDHNLLAVSGVTDDQIAELAAAVQKTFWLQPSEFDLHTRKSGAMSAKPFLMQHVLDSTPDTVETIMYMDNDFTIVDLARPIAAIYETAWAVSSGVEKPDDSTRERCVFIAQSVDMAPASARRAGVESMFEVNTGWVVLRRSRVGLKLLADWIEGIAFAFTTIVPRVLRDGTSHPCLIGYDDQVSLKYGLLNSVIGLREHATATPRVGSLQA